MPPVAKEITQALGWAVLDYWYILFAMLLIGIALAWLNGFADRLGKRRRSHRR